VRKGQLAGQIVISRLHLLEHHGLARRLGAKGSDGAGDGFAVFLIALDVNVLACKHGPNLHETYISLQDQVVHQVDDLGHGGFLSTLSPRRVRELDRFAIAQESAGQQQVVEVRRRCLQVVCLHCGAEKQCGVDSVSRVAPKTL
jgi:hypothetical protein